MFRATAVLLFTIVCSAAVAEELSDEKLHKIAAIDYRGIEFSSNQQTLVKTLPNVKLSDNYTGSDDRVLTYEFRDDPAIDCVLFRFFDDALVEIKYFYFPTRVAAMGGAKPLTSLAVEEYGHPTKRTNETLFWDYPTIDRMIVVASENGQWSMSILHRSRRLEISDYKDASAAPKESRMHVGPSVPDKSKRINRVATKAKTINPVAADILNKYEVNARDYGYGNIKIGIDRSVLGFRYNKALGDQRETRRNGDHLHFGGRLPADMGVVTYVVEQGRNRRLLLGYQYGKLVSITTLRGNLKLSRVASLENDQFKATEEFGPDIYLKDGRNLTWHFRSVNRKVDYRVFDAKDRTQIVSLRVSLLHLNLP